LIPLRPITNQPKPNAPKKSKAINLICATELDQELKNGAFMILTGRELVKTPDNTILRKSPL